MEDTLGHYIVKVYDKKGLEAWELPDKVKELLAFDKNDFYFMISAKDKEVGESHVHLSLYPATEHNLYLLDIETSHIIPQLLHNFLTTIKNTGFSIVTSTGFCTHKDICHFGIFFSGKYDGDINEILPEIKKQENVKDAKIYSYSCEGCREV